MNHISEQQRYPRAPQDQKKAKSAVSKFIDGVEELSTKAATTGQELNGIKVAGVIGQTLTLLAATTHLAILTALDANENHQINSLSDQAKGLLKRYEKNLERLAAIEEVTNGKVDLSTSSAQNIPAQRDGSSQTEANQAAIAQRENTPETSAEDQSIGSTVSQTSETAQPQIDGATAVGGEAVSQAIGAFTDIIHQIGSYIQTLAKKFQVKAEPPPLESEENSHLNKRLNRIDKYLKTLTQQMDSVEAKISEIEKQCGITPQTPTTQTDKTSVQTPQLLQAEAAASTTAAAQPEQSETSQNNESDIAEVGAIKEFLDLLAGSVSEVFEQRKGGFTLTLGGGIDAVMFEFEVSDKGAHLLLQAFDESTSCVLEATLDDAGQWDVNFFDLPVFEEQESITEAEPNELIHQAMPHSQSNEMEV